MFCRIVTNVGKKKKPWDEVPIEVLIEEERKRKEAQKDQRERLYVPMPTPPQPPPPSHDDIDEEMSESKEDFKIVIKLSC